MVGWQIQARALLPCTSRPAAARASCPAALRVAPYDSPRVALCCPAHHALLQPARPALLPHASRPTAARASRFAAPRVAPCCIPRVAPCCPARRALLQLARRALLPCTARTLLLMPPRPSRAALPYPIRPTTRTTAAATGVVGVETAVVAAVGVVAAVVAVTMELFGAEFLAVARCSYNSIRPLRPSSFVSGFTSVESAPSGTAPAEALHTFTLDSGASRFLAQSTTVLPCLAVPSSSLSGLHLPSFSTNLVSNAVLQDEWVNTFTPGGQRVAICTYARTGHHLATFTRQVASLFSCRSLSHQTLLWHHRLGHPSLPRLRGMHRRLLVSGLPRSLPPLPALPAPPCLPCVEGRHCAAPQSSSFPPIEAPLQTLHLDLWGTTRVRGQGAERYFLPVVDDYSRYTTVFPLRTKGEVPAVLIPWIRAVHLQLRWRFRTDLLVLCVHYDRGGAFTSDLLRAFCQGEGIEESFMLPGSPQQNGVAESHIGLVMEIARTSLIHAAAPQFLWPFAVRYAEQQLNLWPRVSLPETSPTLRWMGEVGDASRFRVRGARALVRDTSVDKLSSRTIPCVFLGFVPDMPGWQFYHPTSHRVFPSQDVTFDKSVPFYCLFPYRTAPLPPPPLFLTPGPPSIDPLPPQGPAPSGVSHVDPLPLAKPLEVTSNTSSPAEGDDVTADAPVAYRHTPRLETPPGFPPRPSSPPLQPVAVDSSAAGGGATRGAASRGAEPVREVLGGVEPEGAVPEGARLGGVESANVPPGLVSKRGPLSPQ
ncbi:unnamed protein product [Closterium sp. NIES-53]